MVCLVAVKIVKRVWSLMILSRPSIHTSWQAVRLLFSCCHDKTLVIFLQTDIMSGGQWIDKAALICKEAEISKATLLWHKITFDPEVVNMQRRGASADYSHLLCFVTASVDSEISSGRSAFNGRCELPDLMPRGRKVYAQGMGTDSMARVLQWIRSAGSDVLGVFCFISTTF